jgi:ribosome maturation protein Sdo1|tara:strand:- start:43 stop:261 length:219 start_codon:yes stop_codon:yes gene_type:complete
MEATLLTFKIVLDVKGNIVSDLGGLPITDVDKVFRNEDDAYVIKKIIREGTIKLQGIHKYLEDEVTAIQYVD